MKKNIKKTIKMQYGFHSYPNQKTIIIQKKPVKTNFLQVSNEEWALASRLLGASGLQLYMYLASNKDNYHMALSQVAVERAIGLKRTTYYEKVNLLKKIGYLVPHNESETVFDFYTTPFGMPINEILECENTINESLAPEDIEEADIEEETHDNNPIKDEPFVF